MSRKRKEELKNILINRDRDDLIEWLKRESSPLRILTPMLFDPDILIQWRAVEAFGTFAAEKSKRELNYLREVVRRMFWSMNDESGNLNRRAPETIGEILYNAPELISEYGKVLISFTFEEPFERGAHWGVARIAEKNPEALKDFIGVIEVSLKDSDPYIRRFAAIALNVVYRGDRFTDKLSEVKKDVTPVEIYDVETGVFKTISLNEGIN